ncbi:MAG: hypothetical protein FWB73_01320 [Treponema sp.]|nr:hypothetical protein [Treponema sp.]
MKKTVFLRIFGVLSAIALIIISCDMSYQEPVAIVDAATPRITTQPANGSVEINEDFSMTINAAVNDTGDLKYQWYSYSRHHEYHNHAGKKLDNTDDTHVVSFGEEGIYYFYVIVTNENTEVTGRQIVSVRSQPIIVAVYDPNNAMFPVIEMQPVSNAGVIWGPRMSIAPLMITAVVGEDKGELSYQWYMSETFNNENGTLIAGATAPMYVPVVPFPDVLEPKEFYYFVVVSNTDISVSGRRISSIVSSPVFIRYSVNPNADVPVISEHPSGEIIFIGGTVSPLTIETSEPADGGTISYQWYSNNTSSNEGGSLINGATNASYTPPVSTTSAGQYYYYVVVTNTNLYVTNPTSLVRSRVAELVVTNYTSDAIKNPNAIITVNFNDKFQYVRGFGGQDVAWGNFPDYTMANYETMFNPDMLGYNIVRIMILPDNIDINTTMYNLITNQRFSDRSRENYYNFVKLVNGYGGYVLASPWSPPMEWKTNNSVNGGGSLRPNNYRDYAFYLRSFAQHMSDNGAPIYAISIQNEPNYQASGYDGCEWSPNEMRDFFKQVGRFTSQGIQGSLNINYPSNVPGFGGGRELTHVLTVNGESANRATINNAALNDPDARKYIDLLARHIYGERNTNLGGTGAADDNGVYGVNAIYDPDDPREVWMTEFNLNSQTTAAYPNDSRWTYLWQFMNTIDLTIRNNHESGYVWWSMKRFYSMIGDGTAATVNGAIQPRGWGMAHFSKFANETYRLGVTYSGTLANGTTQLSASNINPANYTNLVSGEAATAVKVMAFARHKNGEEFPVNWKDRNVPIQDIKEISIVMYTPTETTGGGGHDMGNVKLQLPQGFIIRGVSAMRSTAADVGDRQNPKPPVWEMVEISQDRNSAYVKLPASQVLSVKFTR